MPGHIIKTPVTDYAGTVAGVRFIAGRGETDSENAVAYFQRQGYTVTPAADDVEPDEPHVDNLPGGPAPVDEAPVEPEEAKRTSRRTSAK